MVEPTSSNARFHLLCAISLFIFASVVAVFSYQFVFSKGNTNIMSDATHEGRLVIGLSQGFVLAYSDFEAEFASGLLPNPALFRSHALDRADLKTLFGGSLSSEVVGFPGKSIRREPTDSDMRRQMESLLISSERTLVTSVFTKNDETIHRSIWPFYAIDNTCVNCHNETQGLSGEDRWKLGDLMGAQVVEKNIKPEQQALKRDSLGISVLIFFAVFALSYCVALFTRQIFLTKELQMLATTDAMTGCINRREMYKRINHLQGPVSGAVLMLDIDKFKAINDAYGHAAGDLVIKSLSELVQRILGKDDWVARMGGEEFLIWLNNASSKDALSLAESIRQQVESLSVKGSESDIQYTVSIGLHVAKELPSSKFKEWVDLADQRLYQAKEAGRNRIVH